MVAMFLVGMLLVGPVVATDIVVNDGGYKPEEKVETIDTALIEYYAPLYENNSKC